MLKNQKRKGKRNLEVKARTCPILSSFQKSQNKQDPKVATLAGKESAIIEWKILSNSDDENKSNHEGSE